MLACVKTETFGAYVSVRRHFETRTSMTSSAATSAQDSRVARGIGFALLSYACFSTADAMVKLSSAHFSVFQIAFTLSVFALIPVLVLTRGRGGLRALR